MGSYCENCTRHVNCEKNATSECGDTHRRNLLGERGKTPPPHKYLYYLTTEDEEEDVRSYWMTLTF